jgi:hypothetical protein
MPSLFSLGYPDSMEKGTDEKAFTLKQWNFHGFLKQLRLAIPFCLSCPKPPLLREVIRTGLVLKSSFQNAQIQPCGYKSTKLIFRKPRKNNLLFGEHNSLAATCSLAEILASALWDTAENVPRHLLSSVTLEI